MSTFTAGQKVRASQLAQGTIVGWGQRITNSSASVSSTDIGVLRLDNVTLLSGRSYAIRSNALSPASSVSTDAIRLQVRYRTDGTSAGVTDTVIPGGQAFVVGNASGWNTITFDFQYVPSGNQTLSILLCMCRFAGTGSAVLFADGTRTIEIKVFDSGLDVGNTGVNI